MVRLPSRMILRKFRGSDERLRVWKLENRNSKWKDIGVDDGSVQDVAVIKGYSLLANAATEAVRPWKYRSLVVKGKPVNKFVVVLTFDKHGKTH